MAAHRYSLAYTWADVNAPAARSRIDNCAQWGIGFVAGGSHLVVGVKDDGLWTFTPTGDRGHRFRPVDCDLKFVCSPVEPVVVADEVNTSGSKRRLYCCRLGDGGGGLVIRTVQQLLWHDDGSTTMIDTHVQHRSGLAVKSPLDG